MILNIPMQYPAAYVARGRRSPTSCYLITEAAVTVREVRPEEAPLAFLVADASGATPELAPLGDRGRRILEHDGAFWREVADAVAFQAFIEARNEDRDAWSQRQHDNPFAKPGNDILCWLPDFPGKTRAEVEQETVVREWRDDGGVERRRDAQMRANDTRVVDGVLYERCGEPCWELAIEDHEVLVRLALAEPDLASRQHDATEAVHENARETVVLHARWNLNRLADAVAAARALGARMDPPAERVRVAARARVLNPGAAAYADDCAALERAADRILKKGAEHLGWVPREAAMAWYALRDAVEGGEGRATPALAAAVSRLAVAWRQQVAPGRTTTERLYGEAGWSFRERGQITYTHTTSDTLPMALAACRSAVERWENRPADGREWLHLGGTPTRTVCGDVRVREVLTLEDLRVLGRSLGTDLTPLAGSAADGRCRVLEVVNGPTPAAAAVIGPDGSIERIVGPAGRGATRAVATAIEQHAACLAVSVPPSPSAPAPR